MRSRFQLLKKCSFLKPNALRVVVFMILAGGFPCLQAQDQDSTPQRGFSPTASYLSGGVETINILNGNLILRIPLVSMPQGRGSSHASAISLVYNSKIWDTHHEGGLNDLGTQEVDKQVLGQSSQGGWKYNLGRYDLQLFDRRDQYNNANPTPVCPAFGAYKVWKLFVIFPDGSQHEFRPTGYFPDNGYNAIRPDGWAINCATGAEEVSVSTPLTYYSVDGTYTRLEFAHDADALWWNNPWTLYMPDGSRVSNGTSTTGPQTITDRNGNFITLQNITYNGHPSNQIIDQLGRSIIIEHNLTNQDLVYLLSANGGVPICKWTVNWKTITVNKTYLAATGTHETLADGLAVLDYILFPTEVGNLRYTFGYNAGTANPSVGWGEISSVTLPPGTVTDGAQASYTYTYDNSNTNFASSFILKNRPTQKNLTYKLEYDGASQSTTETTNYTTTASSTVVTGPDGGVVEEFYNQTSPPLAWDYRLVHKTSSPDGGVVERIWQPNTPYGEPSANPYVKTEFRSVRNSSGTLDKTAIRDYNYDKNGNLTRVADYDWVDYSAVPRDGSGKPTSIPASAVLKRVSNSTYFNATPDATNTTTDSPNAYHKATTPGLRRALASQEVASNSQTLSRAEFTYDNVSTTGNLTQERSWDSAKGALTNPLTTGNSITLTHQYDSYGNRTLTTDARGYQTRWDFGLINGLSGLYPTQIDVAYTNPEERTTTLQYDFARGWVTRSTDADNNVATSTAYDVLGRPVLVRAAEGKPEETQKATTYDDVNRRVIVKNDLNTVGDGKRVSIQHLDQLGRVRLSRQLEDAASQSATDETTGIKMQTRYLVNTGNRYTLVSNPYRANYSSGAGGEASMGWTLTQTQLDASGTRLTQTLVKNYSGSALPAPWGANSSTTGTATTAYNSFYKTVTDQASKARRAKVDGLGRLVEVVEDPSGSAFLTSYTYDALSNLTQVSQGVQTRTFAYSSLSRLTSASNPESGTVSYLYDGNGNLTSKTDARNTVTAYVYDPLNRLTNRNYTIAGTTAATPNVTYTYDAASVTNSKGRLTSVSSSASTTNFGAYDALGRVTQSSQVTSGNTYSFSYVYNRAAALTSQTYPSGKVITTAMDTAGRIAYVQKQAGNYYAGDASNLIQYAAHGGMQQVKLGNGLWDEARFNSRLQPLQIGLGQTATGVAAALTTTNSNRLLLDYGYGTTTNNGNLQTQTIRIGGTTLSQSYTTYDSLNRLVVASESGNWSQTYGYDQFGNRWVSAGSNYGNTPALTPTLPSAFNTANNRLVNSSYDNVGNLTTDATSRTFTYDAENHQVSYNGGSVTINATYDYDGDGKRVRQIQNGVTTVFVYNAQGQMAAEYRTSASTVPGGTSYYTSDHLGSTRVVTNPDSTIRGRHDYLPFGEEIANAYGRSSIVGYGSADVRQKFTVKERDSESGLDYFLARYYSGAQGRFQSVDPQNADATLEDPRSWNGFAYGRNNPLLYTDPTGETVTICGHTSSTHCTDVPYDVDQLRRFFPDLIFSGGDIYAKNQNGSRTLVGTYDVPLDPSAIWVFREAGNRAARDIQTGAIAIGVFATAYVSTYAGPAIYTALAAGGEAGVLYLGKGFQIVRDATGRVHGELPKFIPKNLTRDQLEFAAQELRASIQVRQQAMIQLGEKGNHGLRVANEQQLLYRIEQRLGTR